MRDDAGRWQCLRCGAATRIGVGVCVRCGRDACAACTNAHGRSGRACGCGLGAPVLRSRRHDGRDCCSWILRLSPAQGQAAERLLGTEAKRALVWAACGLRQDGGHLSSNRGGPQQGRRRALVPRRYRRGARPACRPRFQRSRPSPLRGSGKFADARLVVATTSGHALIQAL